MTKRAALAILLAVSTSGCPAGVCPNVRFEDATSALSSHGRASAPIEVVRAEARVDRRDAEGRIRGTVLMMLQLPDRVRFDAMTQLGPAAILTSDGTTFALTDLREEKFFVGPTCPANIERLLGIPLSGDDVALLLTGRSPRIDAERSEIACDGGVYRVTLHGADGRTQHLALAVSEEDVAAAPEQQRMRLLESRVHAPDGSLEWRVTWDDHRAVADPRGGGGVTMPYRVRFEHPSRGIDTLVRFESIDLNARVPDDAFVQTPRPGLEVETVECR